MGPPLKPFINISQRQQRRRMRAALQADIETLHPSNIPDNIASVPTLPLCSLPIVSAPNNNFLNEIEGMSSFHDLGQADYVANSNATVERSTTPEEIATQSATTDPTTDLRAFLAHWAIENKLSQSVVNSLLVGLRKFGHPELPSDARTLNNTPSTVDIQDLAGGTYAHYGLERALKEQLRIGNCNILPQCATNTGMPVTLQININIDGVPLAKSSRSQFWPILGKIVATQFVEPFVVGIFHGSKKPSSATEYLKPFLTEYTKLYNEGFVFEDQRYLIRLNAVLADTPARNFISSFPGHNSRCAKCIQPGETVNRRRLFQYDNVPLRTNETFREGLPTVFQDIISPFEAIGVDMVKQFPLDYMHLLCLGTMKKLLLLWINNMGKSKEALEKISAFNDFYQTFRPFVPAEFSRHPRTLDEVAQWKATEFRLFLLYLGPVALQYFLTRPQIIHFNALNCAVRILCDSRLCVQNNSYAQELMIYFVHNMQLLYGEETLIYNIHNLVHISADVLYHGPLDAFSCFPFENFLQKIKLMIKGGAKPLAQIMKRLTERSIHRMPSANTIKSGYHLNKKSRVDYQCPEGYSDPHHEIQFPNFLLTDKNPNNCCYLSNKSAVLIEHILHSDGIPVIVGREYLNTCSIAEYPCDSRLLGIYAASELSELQTWNISLIDRKGFVVPCDADSTYIFPLIHTDA